MGLFDAWGRIANGIDPWTALTTSAPKAGPAMSSSTYYSPQADPHPIEMQGAPIQNTGAANLSSLGGSVLGSSTSYDANTDPNLINQAKGLIGNDQNTLNSLYNTLNPMLTSYANDAKGRVDKAYQQQMTNNDQTYGSTVGKINANYGARNAYDSSYRGVDLGDAQRAYETSNAGLNDQKQAAYGQIGSTIQGVQDQLNNKPKYDLSQYNDVNALTELHNQLGQHIAALRSTQQQLTPQGELVNKLNSIATPTSNLDSTVKAQLNSLISANTPSEAMIPLATAYLTRAGITDPRKQQEYFAYLQSLQSPPSAAQNNLQLQGA